MTNPLTKEEMDEIKARVNRGAAYPLEIRQCRALISALESAWTERDNANEKCAALIEEMAQSMHLAAERLVERDTLASQLAEERAKSEGLQARVVELEDECNQVVEDKQALYEDMESEAESLQSENERLRELLLKWGNYRGGFVEQLLIDETSAVLAETEQKPGNANPESTGASETQSDSL